ncbi:FAD-dependent oxidoreductase [Rosenbergiella sp. S61]|uniref:D-amino-acid oxidase n=1 Tax=Rosenbergiella gaditana TaxID=2726987 RepID=A0ABS5SWS1_9GAMM|nr:FAD-dependent oxidoreductase [Rosenbergiella gaditana]MBT0724541.1 FAD-dependent oxidoreductase [Rosenbergiella gaditana]
MSRWSVIGRGVSGLCVAKLLVEQGEQVEVIEQPGYTSASWYAGGMLAPYCEAESAASEVVTLGQHALAWWQQRVPDVQQRGTLVVAPARDQQELKIFASKTSHFQWVKPMEVEEDLGSRFESGLFFAEEGHLNPRQALTSLAQQLVDQGVVFHSTQPSGKIIDCRGIHAQSHLPQLRAVRGEMLRLRSAELDFSRPIRLLHPRFPCYLVPRGAGEFMLGATMVETDDNRGMSARAAMELLSAAYTLHPAFAEAEIVETASGLRPAYPTNLPSIQYQDNRFYLNGMYRHGFLLAPRVAQQLVEQLAKEKSNADLT